MPRIASAKPVVDLVKRLTTRVGTVDNLYGNVFQPEGTTQPIGDVGWYYVQGVGTIPREIFIDAAINDRVAGTIPSNNGVADFSRVGYMNLDVPVLLYTGVTTELPPTATVTIPIEVVAPGADLGIYVNDVFVIRGNGKLSTSVVLGPGKNTLQVVVSRLNPATFSITVPETLAIGELPAPPQAPVWHATPLTYGFFGDHEDSAGFRLYWYDSSFAGSWKIEKTSYRLLGTVLSVSQDEEAGTYTFVVSDSHVGTYGEALVGGDTILGEIIDTEENGFSTNIVVRSDVEMGDWINSKFYVSSVQSIIGTIEREDAVVPGDGIYQYVDLEVKESLPYAYRLAATHPLHPELESGWSDKHAMLAHDVTPPGSVTDVEVQVVNGEIIVDYTTPDDVDYAGTRVYKEEDGIFIPLLNDFGSPSSSDQLRFYPAGAGTYWLRTFDWARNVQPEGSGYSFEYTGSLGTTYGPPVVTINILASGRYDLTIEAIATTDVGDPIRLEWAIGVKDYGDPGTGLVEGVTTVSSGPILIDKRVNSMTKIFDRYIKVRGTNLKTGKSDEVTFIADWDDIPGILPVEVRKWEVGSGIVGWSVFGVTDDDTQSILASVTGNLTISKVSYTGEEDSTNPLNTSVTKTFRIDLLQSPGTSGELRIDANSKPPVGGMWDTTGVIADPPYIIQLARPPVTKYYIKDLSSVDAEVHLTADPPTATIFYKLYYANEAEPATWESVGGSTAIIPVQKGNHAAIVKFYSIVSGVPPEEVQTLYIDADDSPDVYITDAMGEDNILRVVVNVDDTDIAYWRWWSRPDQWPTRTGDVPTTAGELLDDYLRGEYVREDLTTVEHYASPGQWYVVALGYDFSGKPGEIALIPEPVSVGSTPSLEGNLFNLGARREQEAGAQYHELYWEYNQAIEDDYNSSNPQYTVTVTRKVRGQTMEVITDADARHPAQDIGANVPFHGSVRDPEGFTPPGQFDPYRYLTFTYYVTLKKNGVPQKEYTTTISGYYTY